MRALAHRLRMTRDVLAAPSVTVSIGGDDAARRHYERLTAPHPRLRVIPHKRWGVALAEVAETEAAYLGGPSRKLLRRKRALARRSGYTFAPISGEAHAGDVLEIHRSAPRRQGEPMLAHYTDEASVRRHLARTDGLRGVLDTAGRLRAYAQFSVHGDVAVFTRAIGHADHLPGGAMYLLVSECMLELVRQRQATGRPRWAVFDTFWGARPGMAYFKRRVGFAPYRVDWEWVGDA